MTKLYQTMLNLIGFFVVCSILSVHMAKAQSASQVLSASTSAINNLNHLMAQSRQQLTQIYRTSQTKISEILSNRNLNETVKAAEMEQIRRLLKNQLTNWRNTLNEKIAFLEKDCQNAIDLIFAKPVNNNIFMNR